MLRTKKQVDRVRLFLRPSSAYFAFGNSIRKDAPKVGEEYKSSRTVRSSILPPECAKNGTVLHRRGLPKLLKFFLMELYFSQDHSIWSHLWWLLGCLKCWFAKWPTILGCSTAHKQPSSHQIRHMSKNLNYLLCSNELYPKKNMQAMSSTMTRCTKGRLIS